MRESIASLGAKVTMNLKERKNIFHSQENESWLEMYDAHSVETPIEGDLKEAISHGIIVSDLAYLLARELNIRDRESHDIAVAGLLHDIGKLKLVNYVYQKRGDEKLRIDEVRYRRLHSSLGYAILKEQGYSEHICQYVLYHHENFDGSGYPNNLKGDQIPLGAKILRVCDAFGALISNRPYRTAFDAETAIQIMIEEVKDFDMSVFLAFLRIVHSDDFVKVLDNLGINE